MRLSRKDIVAGYPATYLRDFMKWLGPQAGVYSNAKIKRFAHIDFDVLVTAGLLEKKTDYDKRDYYERTTAGGRVANATFLKPITKERAKAIVKAFFDRILAAGIQPFLFYVDEARLFGSIIDPAKPDCSDVDVAIKLSRRDLQGRDFVELAMERTADRPGMDYFRRLVFPELEVRRFLKGGNPRLELHDMDELVTLEAKSVSLWPVREFEF